MNKKITAIFLLALWAALTLGAWLLPAQPFSDAERRPLAQLPEISTEKVLSGKFMSEFTDFSLDQFPLRDSFRRIKSLFHYNVLGQKDNNGIYLSNGSAAKQEYPLNGASLNHMLDRLQFVYDTYLKDSNSQIVFAVVPDKNYYLAEPAGQLSMDYDALFSEFREGLPWAPCVDLTGYLSGEDYYRTDTHWRQESLLDTADVLCEALGVATLKDYTVTELERPFYGVYYGQSALPMEPDRILILENALLSGCTVYDHETKQTGSVYDMSKLESKDLYDVYLSGARALLTVENPQGQPGKELIVFRDSFGSSLVPLLLSDYEKVTLVDLRYIRSDLLDQFLEFSGQDVLFLYSTLVLNNSASIK